MKTGGTSGKKNFVFTFHSVCTVFEFLSKTGCTSGKKDSVFTFHSVCTVFVPFKMGYFQLLLIIRDLHNYKGFHMNPT